MLPDTLRNTGLALGYPRRCIPIRTRRRKTDRARETLQEHSELTGLRAAMSRRLRTHICSGTAMLPTVHPYAIAAHLVWTAVAGKDASKRQGLPLAARAGLDSLRTSRHQPFQAASFGGSAC